MLPPIELLIQLLNQIPIWNYINSNATLHEAKCSQVDLRGKRYSYLKCLWLKFLTSNIDKTHAYENTCLGALPWSWNWLVPSKELENLSFHCFMIYTPLLICKRALFTECHTGEWICSSLKFLHIRERDSLGTWNGTFRWMNFTQRCVFRLYLLLLSSNGKPFHGTGFTNTGKKHTWLFLFTKHENHQIFCICKGFSSITSIENSISELRYLTFVYPKM